MRCVLMLYEEKPVKWIHIKGLVCFLLVTKPLMGYSLLQSASSYRTSSPHFRRNEEQQQIHGKEYRCYVDTLDTAIHAQRRSGVHAGGTRAFPIQAFTTQNRLPVRERPIPSRQEISQLLRPPAPVPSKENINVIYLTTPTPIAGNKFHHQTFRPASHFSTEFKPTILPSNLDSPANSAVHKTSIVSTTASPTLSLGSYSSGGHQPYTQKKPHHFLNAGISNSHTFAQNGKYQHSTVVSVPRPVNSNQPGPQQRPLPLRPLAPVNNDNLKPSYSAVNNFQHANVPERITTLASSTLPPQKIIDGKQHANVVQVDNIKREIYHVTKPVVENSPDSKPNVRLKPENDHNSSQQKRQDLKLSGNELGYFYPGLQTTGPSGQLGLAPYSLDFVRVAGHHSPIENSLLISSMWNPAMSYGLGGVGNIVPNRYGAHLYNRDPIVNLLLKNYGKYLPYGLGSYGLYSYSAPSNIDNSKPFGLYKYEDRI